MRDAFLEIGNQVNVIPAVDAAPNGTQKLASFDVFDTVITRTWAKPSHLFLSLGQLLVERGLLIVAPAEWLTLRMAAESRLRREAGDREITLQQIYAQLIDVFQYENAMLAAAALEITLELESHRPVPQGIKEIEVCRNAGCRIIFISDMYLPKEAIQQSLTAHGIWREGDLLFVSNETGETKASGKLFNRVQRELAIPFSQWWHSGDNHRADCQVPRRLGIETKHLSRAILSTDESAIADLQRLPLEFRSLLAGSMRLARVNHSHAEQHPATIADTGANVVGPVLLAFVTWCMTYAKKNGIKRLYFIARDGQLPHAIAQLIERQMEFGIECRYLYGSRGAWRSAAIRISDTHELDYVFEAESLTFADVAHQLCLDPATLADFTSVCKSWDGVLSHGDRVVLRERLQEQAAMAEITKRSTEYRRLVQQYFRQEGLADGVPFAFVDIGWRGTLQRAASLILNDIGVRPAGGITGLYFGLSSRNRAFPNDRMEAFLHDGEVRSMNLQRLCNGPVLEQFTEADHGTVTGFTAQPDGRVVPIFKEAANALPLNWGLGVQHEAALCLVNEWLRTAKPEFIYGIGDAWHTVAYTLLRRFITMPSAAEAEVFGVFPKTNSQNHEDHQQLAPPYAWWTSLLVSVLGSRGLGRLPRHAGLWPQASMRRAGHSLCVRIMNFRHRLFDTNLLFKKPFNNYKQK